MEEAEHGKSSYIYREIAEQIEKGNTKIYIITPEQFSFTAENKLLAEVKEGAVLQAEVLTFARMAYRIMQETGGANDTTLSQVGKSMLVDAILRKQKKNLTFLGNSDENIEVVENAITEFKKHCISTQKLEEVSQKLEDTYLQAKGKDLTTVDEEYQNYLQEGYIDENDTLDKLVQNIEKSQQFVDTLIYIDEFAGFTMQEYQIIEKLLSMAKRVTITVTTDSLWQKEVQEEDIFYDNKKTIERILSIAKAVGVTVEPEVKLDKKYRFKTPELQYLESNLYATKYHKYGQHVENLSLFLAKNPYSEVEQVAKQIIKLVKEKKYRFQDIAIITKDISTYSGLVKAISEEYEIPVFVDEKKDLSQNIFVKYMLALLSIFAKNWSYDSVMDYVKSGFLKIDKEDIYLFEKYTLALGIEYKKWYEGEWNFGEVTESEKEEIEKVKAVRKQVITPLVSLKEKMNASKTYEDITKKLYLFLLEQNIQEQLQAKAEELEKLGNLELAGLYEMSWNTVIEVLEELVMVFGKETVSFENYLLLLKTGLKTASLGKIPATQDVVLMGDVERSRSHKVKAVFLLGVNDGVFPSIHKEEGFLGDEDRRKLKEKGIELAKGTLEQLYEENFNIYKAFTTAEEKIRNFLSIFR